jgi:hypothetical protein
MPEPVHETHYMELGTENLNKWKKGTAYAMCGERIRVPDDVPKRGEVPTCKRCCELANQKCPF